MKLNLTELQFGSFLTYCPKSGGDEIENARNAMIYLKNDNYIQNPPILMSELIAKTMAQRRSKLPFESLFKPNTILIPCPKSSLMQRDTLWVPQRIASALISYGFGKETSQCLIRKIPVRKSATSPPQLRPTAYEHYDSMIIQESLVNPTEIVLIDDIVTRGATLIGAANRIADLYPNASIKAFAAMRTMSNPSDFKKLIDPCIGTIELVPDDGTFRRP